MAQGRTWYIWRCYRCPRTVWHPNPVVVKELAWLHQAVAHHQGRQPPQGTWAQWTVWRGRPWGCPARSQAPLTLIPGGRRKRKER
jgi:hypothetical protein